MSTHEERLIELEEQCKETTRQLNAAFKRIDEVYTSRAEVSKQWETWKALLEVELKILKDLKLEIFVHDVNNFISTSRKIVWGMGIAAITTFVGAIVTIIVDILIRRGGQ